MATGATVERACFGSSGRILMCHLRKMPHQEEGLYEATAPRLLPDLRFWLVSDSGWGNSVITLVVDRTQVDMPAFSDGAMVLSCSLLYFRDEHMFPWAELMEVFSTENHDQIRPQTNAMSHFSSSSIWRSGCLPLFQVYIHFLSQSIGSKVLSVWTPFR